MSERQKQSHINRILGRIRRDGQYVRNFFSGHKEIGGGLSPVQPEQQRSKKQDGFELRAGVRATFIPDGGMSAQVSVEMGAPKEEPLNVDEEALMRRISVMLLGTEAQKAIQSAEVERRVQRLETRAEIEETKKRLEAAGISIDDPNFAAHVINAGRYPSLQGPKLKRYLLSITSKDDSSQGI